MFVVGVADTICVKDCNVLGSCVSGPEYWLIELALHLPLPTSICDPSCPAIHGLDY